MPAIGPQAHAEAVIAWVLETCPDIVGSYDYATPGKDQGLPDVVVEVEAIRDSYRDDRFPPMLQQVEARVFDMVASIMVDSTDPRPAAIALRDFSVALMDAAREDATLGERVFLTARDIEADFVPQFVRYDDGTEGRQVQIRLAIAQLLPED